MSRPAASVILTSHNYARFLPSAIDSALSQDAADVEIIVVDDGSTDDSRVVIESYGDRVRGIVKPCGGQGSAMNAGYALARGDVILFLDADDVLSPDAVRVASAALRAEGVVKAHWPLEVIDESGNRAGRLHPSTPLPEGAFRDELIARGPWMCENPPTSGNAWSRALLDRVLPMPEEPFRICADAYLLAAAPLHGRISRIQTPLSFYRLHGRNNFWNRPFEELLSASVASYEAQCQAASDMLRREGVAHDLAAWRRHSWWHRLQAAVEAIAAVVPERRAFALADEDQWGTPDVLRGRRRVAFPGDADGQYAGPPADDADAVARLDRLRTDGPPALAIGWPADWYLDVYPGFARRLRDEWTPVARHEDAVTIYRPA